MSTRCQVKVVQEGLDWKEEITLYHHYDGYPSYMLPLIREGFSKLEEKERRAQERFEMTGPFHLWEGGRAGKVASFLCAADPGGFEPQESHELHPDIEWYYVLRVHSVKDGRRLSKPLWTVDVYTLEYLSPDIVDSEINLRRVAKDISVSTKSPSALQKLGKRIEDQVRKEVEEEELRMTSLASYSPALRGMKSPSKSQPGWFREPARHSLAARGIRTSRRR